MVHCEVDRSRRKKVINKVDTVQMTHLMLLTLVHS